MAAIVLVAVQIRVVLKTAQDPAQSDFANYFTPAFVLSNGGDLSGLYGRDEFARAMESAGLRGLGSFVPHPPTNALWLLPVAGLSPSVAKVVWTAFLVGGLLGSVVALARLVPEGGRALAVVLAFAPFLSVRNALAFGQPYPILALLLLAGALALERRREFLGGMLLGFGVSFKPYALGLCTLFLRRDRLVGLLGFCLGVFAPLVLLIGLAGTSPIGEFASSVLPWMVRGDIQDPFSPTWGSASALANRLFRFEPDLNPSPWLNAPWFARALASASSVGLMALGVLSGRTALRQGRALDAVGCVTAFALAASPFAASYHLVLLTVTAAAGAFRLADAPRLFWLLGWAALGSPAMYLMRGVGGIAAPLAYLRLFALVAFALVAAWPFLSRRAVAWSMAVGLLAGLASVSHRDHTEPWARIQEARGYSMMKPYFCGSVLRWWSPSADGRRLESRGGGTDCVTRTQDEAVVSRFENGSWNLYLQAPTTRIGKRLTFSDANEVDPVLTPDGCAVVFASDQGRGLGSLALYRLDLQGVNAECDRSGPSATPR